jgi:hypothetical protein
MGKVMRIKRIVNERARLLFFFTAHPQTVTDVILRIVITVSITSLLLVACHILTRLI